MWSATDCHLFFPSDGGQYNHITFRPTDKYEEYLDAFDQSEVRVFLQVEPGHANVDDLITLVLNRYGHHPCVIGFGVDVEWYREVDNPGWGIPVNDSTALHWEQLVKQHNSSYRLFLKHWDRNWMPSTYRGDLIFVDDSQGFPDLNAAVNEFTTYWADYFFPNPVFFQIGYAIDKPWWETLENPAQDFGTAIVEHIAPGQECGVFWVDFTLRDVLPTSSTQVRIGNSTLLVVLTSFVLLITGLIFIQYFR